MTDPADDTDLFEPVLGSAGEDDFLAAEDVGTDDANRTDSTLALFEGDSGGLSSAQRRALVVLLKNRFVSADRRPAEWRVIREDPAPIKSRLNDLFLDLHIDTRYEVAFKYQAVSDDGGAREFPTLLHDMAYTREETILLVFLRHRFQSEQNAGHEDVTVEYDDMIEHVTAFRPASDTNRSGGEAAARNAVKNLVKADVLMTTNDAARLRISPVIAVLLPLARLHELWEWLMNENAATAAEDLE
ncbi:DUF4194 domain-containing protein [Kribbella sp. NPDC020789]